MWVQCQILSEDERQKIHDESIKILEEVGAKFMSDRALKILKDHGARIDTETKTARITAEMVRADLAAGAPAGPDGRINLVLYAAWLAREASRG